MAPEVQLIHGDCLQLMRSIPDASIDMVLCDLPYGVTANDWDSVIPLEPLWNEYRRITKPTAAIVLTATQPFASQLITSNPKMFRYEWIWEKTEPTGFLDAKKKPLKNHEQVLVFYRKQPTYNPQMTLGTPYKTVRKAGTRKSTNYGGHNKETVTESTWRYPKTVQTFKRDRPRIHPTQKPVALMEYMIRTYTNPGDVVLDNCLGSGTTGVAALKAERRFIGIEQDSHWFEVAQKRVADLIGEKKNVD